MSGDFAAIPVECYTNNGPQEVFDEHRQHMEKILNEFAPLASKVYYIPGNVRCQSILIYSPVPRLLALFQIESGQRTNVLSACENSPIEASVILNSYLSICTVIE